MSSTQWAVKNARKRAKARAPKAGASATTAKAVEKIERSPTANEPDATHVTEYKRHEPKDIYTLYDARARDYRTILIAIMAGEIALLVQFVNSLYDSRAWAAVLYGVLMVGIGAIGYLSIAPEVEEVSRRAYRLRQDYIKNRSAVPPVDTLLLGNNADKVAKLFKAKITKQFRSSIGEDQKL